MDNKGEYVLNNNQIKELEKVTELIATNEHLLKGLISTKPTIEDSNMFQINLNPENIDVDKIIEEIIKNLNKQKGLK